MKQPTPFFLSYTRADQADIDRFLEVLNPLLRISPKYDFHLWQDTAILPGEKWREEIDTALKTSRFGLLCVTPNFLANSFITNDELPALLAKSMVIPVGIQRISFSGDMDLKGLKDRQLFHDKKGRTFDACGRGPSRRDFARELCQKIGALLEKYPC